MNREKMITNFYSTSIEDLKTVSEPQYYQGNGPYILAVIQNKSNIEFHGYEFVDADTFVVAPDKFSEAFYDAAFLDQAAGGLRFEGIDSKGRYFFIYLRKVVPDSPACRFVVQKLYETSPKLVPNIFLVDEFGNLSRATYFLHEPILLN